MTASRAQQQLIQSFFERSRRETNARNRNANQSTNVTLGTPLRSNRLTATAAALRTDGSGSDSDII
jgi:hypothetical protein